MEIECIIGINIREGLVKLIKVEWYRVHSELVPGVIFRDCQTSELFFSDIPPLCLCKGNEEPLPISKPILPRNIKHIRVLARPDIGVISKTKTADIC